MESTCIRLSELPNASPLLADVLYRPERTARFYFHPNRDLGSFRAAAAAIDFPAERRARLVEALAVANPGSRSLDRLEQPGTVAVVTGQQVGLFSGPCYTIYKILHAAKLAEWLTSNGVPAVPVFWPATEDHDFAEVNHAWVFDAAHRPHRLEMPGAATGQPVGGVSLTDDVPTTALRTGLQGLPFADDVTALVEQTYLPGRTMGQAFGELIRRVLGSLDILHLDPMAPQFRALAAPALRQAVAMSEELTAGVLTRNSELSAAGYHAQVHLEAQTSLVFLLENGKRCTLRRQGQEYRHNGRRFTAKELIDRAESLSPNALLRPVIQDSMLPTVAYIGGPAETAYLAQSEVLYRGLLGRMPVVVPRSGFTILDKRSRKLMERYNLRLPDFYSGEDALRERIAARLVPPSLKAAIQSSTDDVERTLTRLRGEVASLDSTLAKALDRSSRKIRYQFAKIERKAGREAMRRDGRAAVDAAYLYGLIYPERHLQERLYSILPFLATHGLDLPQRIYEAIQLDCPDHRLLYL